MEKESGKAERATEERGLIPVRKLSCALLMGNKAHPYKLGVTLLTVLNLSQPFIAQLRCFTRSFAALHAEGFKLRLCSA